jgi:uronate dehydrogenase
VAAVPTETVLLTGAAGRIGAMLRPRLARPGRLLRLLDVAPIPPRPGADQSAEEHLLASVSDRRALSEACAGVDAVIHLGGIPTEDDWDRLLDVNINGTHNVFEAARQRGVPRVIFASSNHAVGFHPKDAGSAADYLFPAPDTNYGVSKVAGEAIAALYAARYGMDAFCLRILSCFEQPTDTRMLSTWLSPDDAGRLFEACLSTEQRGFRVAWGVSANTRAWFAPDEARRLGYIARDDAEVFAAQLGEPVSGALESRYVGGAYCGPQFDSTEDFDSD